MKITPSGLLNIVLITMLVTALYFVGVRSASPPPYDPWADINNDGFIDVKDILSVALLYGAGGTPITKASIAFDSDWIDITDKCGQSFSVVHNLNSTDIMVDITGKRKVDGSPHQMYIGLSGYTPGWQRTYGQTNAEYAESMVQTVDGGYALVGYTYSFVVGSNDFYLVKTDAAGNLQWNKTYGGTNDDHAQSIVQTVDGGYALVGWTNSFGAGSYDAYFVKTDVENGLCWSSSTLNSIQLYRGITDQHWNYVRVRIWATK